MPLSEPDGTVTDVAEVWGRHAGRPRERPAAAAAGPERFALVAGGRGWRSPR
ncbi:hypothetical protein SALCHL_000368 [Streptomyces albus subsp. chlorinus]|uniref:hypothetical protein n=1 Tax=Streptomyces albus TaxID=1888 RepID=UPI00156FC433|nr:hypothetical protein [Streptomyces albus]